MKHQKAAFAAGCFWKPQALIDKVKGVVSTEVGYMGGDKKNPTYGDVCSGATGHAETVLVVFGPPKISYGELLEMFWKMHDPTQVNRQGLDVGTQYRSVIFYFTEAQKKAATSALAEKQEKLAGKIATKIAKATDFWKAEEYHQKFLVKNRGKIC
ncbi:MAG: peptide-methionine (S)-S-oxide reductase MsrA [Candidatus Aenigmarchaeota archaeon]|nr:peptide-methionine (S)-S-oxide reductase MsrA [Candidatus Aenigmarchaeota archaeon]